MSGLKNSCKDDICLFRYIPLFYLEKFSNFFVYVE